MKSIFLLTLLFAHSILWSQLTVQHGAGVFLDQNSEVTIQGDVTGNDNIEGDGTMLFNGSRPQSVTFYNNRLPRIVINNRSNVLLLSDMTIQKGLILENGHLQCDRYTLSVSNEASLSGNQHAFIQTGNNGRVLKFIHKDENDYLLPIGADGIYTPLFLKSTGRYLHASVAVGAKAVPSPNKPAGSNDYLSNHWTINRTGINGALFATALYEKVNGNEQDVSPYYWNGFSWQNRNTSIDVTKKSLAIEIPEGNGEVYAMSNANNLSAQNEMRLLPNPVKNIATIIIQSQDEKTAVLKVVDSKGSNVISQRAILQKGTNQVRINVAALAKGNYTITLSSDGSQRSLQMIRN